MPPRTPPIKFRSTGNILSFDYSLRIGKGGEGAIYEVPREPMLVAKIYHANQVTDERGRKLELMVNNPPNDPMRMKGHASIAWPIEILELARTGEIVGFLMPRMELGMSPIVDFFDSKTRILRHTAFSYNYLIRTAINLVSAVRALHAKGYVIGDVNESNVMVSRNSALVTIVDTDSFQVTDAQSGITYRCPVGKEDFTPPELQGKNFGQVDRKLEHDLFGVAVLLFQLLMEGTPPFAGVFAGLGDPPEYGARIARGYFAYCRKRRVPFRPGPLAPSFNILHPSLQKLFLLCFEEAHTNPKARPSADTWYQALKTAEQSLITCSVNDQHFFSDHLNVCPWCERAKKLPDPFPTRSQAESVRTVVSGKFRGTSPPQPPTGPVGITPQPIINTFHASGTSIIAGQSCILYWNVFNAQNITINNGIGQVAPVGSIAVNPSSSTTYTLTAQGAGGTSTSRLKVTVSKPSPIIAFNASTNSIALGQRIVLSWKVAQTYTVSINNGVGPVSNVGQISLNPIKNTTYVLTAKAARTVRQSVTITVNLPPPPMAFKAHLPLSSTGTNLNNPFAFHAFAIALRPITAIHDYIRLHGYFTLQAFAGLNSIVIGFKEHIPLMYARPRYNKGLFASVKLVNIIEIFLTLIHILIMVLLMRFLF
jgi:serine/threonine protein kinase